MLSRRRLFFLFIFVGSFVGLYYNLSREPNGPKMLRSPLLASDAPARVLSRTPKAIRTQPPLQFARYRHLFMEANEVLVPRELLCIRAAGYVFNPQTSRMYCVMPLGKRISVIDTVRNKHIATITIPRPLTSISINSATNTLYVAMRDRVLVVDCASNRFLPPILMKETQRVTADSVLNRIFIWVNDHLKVLDGSTHAVVADLRAEPGEIATNPNTDTIFLCQPHGHKLLAIGARDYKLKKTMQLDEPAMKGVQSPVAVAVSVKTNRIYVCESQMSKRVIILDGKNHEVITTVEVVRNPSRISINPITNRIFVTSGWEPRLDVIDGITDNVVATATFDLPVADFAVDSRASDVYLQLGLIVVICKEADALATVRK